MKKNIIILSLFVLAAIAIFAADTRVITEPDGTKVTIPVNPQRIACPYHPAFDKIVMLSQGSRVAFLPMKLSPWSLRLFPDLKKVPTGTPGMTPDPELFLQHKIDLIFYPKGRFNAANYAQLGIPLVCPYNVNYVPKNIEEHTAEFQKQINFFADILGGDAKAKADKYNKYLADITNRVKAITSKIKESNKPRVYYGRATDLHTTQGHNTVMHWYTEVAGGIYLPKKYKQYFAMVSREDLLALDPDIIMLGLSGFEGKPDKAPSLDGLRAKTNGKVYNVPFGMFYWEMTSCETALLPLYLGKKFHPELFAHWDIIKEMKNFYFEIYGVKISDKDAERILASLPPQ